ATRRHRGQKSGTGGALSNSRLAQAVAARVAGGRGGAVLPVRPPPLAVLRELGRAPVGAGRLRFGVAGTRRPALRRRLRPGGGFLPAGRRGDDGHRRVSVRAVAGRGAGRGGRYARSFGAVPGRAPRLGRDLGAAGGAGARAGAGRAAPGRLLVFALAPADPGGALLADQLGSGSGGDAIPGLCRRYVLRDHPWHGGVRRHWGGPRAGPRRRGAAGPFGDLLSRRPAAARRAGGAVATGRFRQTLPARATPQRRRYGRRPRSQL
ncbi:MAG: COG0398: uncharacterized membrane protein, partial [uncultured Acetobacteraceae bacterium]